MQRYSLLNIHAYISIIVVLLNFVFGHLGFYKLNLAYSKIKNWVLGLLLLEIIRGMAMYYLDFSLYYPTFTSCIGIHLYLVFQVLFGIEAIIAF